MSIAAPSSVAPICELPLVCFQRYFQSAFAAFVLLFLALSTSRASAGSAPDFSSQPPAWIGLPGLDTTLQVDAGGDEPLFFQWIFNGTPLTNSEHIAGADTGELTIRRIRAVDVGAYQLVVTNVFGSSTSAPSIVSIVDVGAWGGNINGESTVPVDATNVVAIAAGGRHSLALRADGTITGWGDQDHGKLDMPPEVTNVVAIAAGYSWSYALRADGSVFEWGFAVFDPLIDSVGDVIAISAPYASALLLRRDGSVTQVGGSGAPPDGLMDAIAVAAGGTHHLALLDDGSVVSWSVNDEANLDVPEDVTNIVAIAAGYDHCMALRRDGTVVCWGENSFGEATVPPEATNVIAIAAGSAYSLALRRDGTVVQWGEMVEPLPVTNSVAIAAGDRHVLVLSPDARFDLPASPNGALVIWQQPVDATVINGETLLSCRAVGVPPLQMQWYSNGVAVLDGTTPWLLLTNNQVAGTVHYTCVVTNEFGAVTSSVAHILTIGPPVIVEQPTNQLVKPGDNVTFAAQSDSVAPAGYQWFFNGAALTDGDRIGGAQSLILQLANVAAPDAGRYWLVVSNAAGVVTSEVATLAMNLPPTDVPTGQMEPSWAAAPDEFIGRWGQSSQIVIDDAGNVYVAGSILNEDTFVDYLTIKYDSNGNRLWARGFNGSFDGEDFATALVVDSSGNVYVTGFSQAARGGQLVTIKYDADGNQLWVATSHDGMDVYPPIIALDPSGNIYVGGQTTFKSIYCYFKYDADGNQVWEYQTGVSNDAMKTDPDGNLYVTGRYYTPPIGWAFNTIKLDPDANLLWIARYNPPVEGFFQRARALALDDARNVYISGISAGPYGDYDFATVKYDSDGNQLWVARYDGPANGKDTVSGMVIDADANVYVTGTTTSFGTNTDYTTIKYSSEGAQLWVARYNGPHAARDSATGIALDVFGNVFVTGASVGNGTGNDFATIKYAPDGTALWVSRYNHGPGKTEDRATAVAVHLSGAVYVTGTVTGTNGSACPLVKFVTATRVTPQGKNSENEFRLLISGEKFRAYQVEWSSDFVNWTPLGTVTLTNDVVSFVDTTANESDARFYRLLKNP